MSTQVGHRHPFIVFADDYGRHPSSSQHLIQRVQRDHPVIWVNTVGVRRPRFSITDLRRGVGVVKRWLNQSPTNSAQPVPAGERVDVLAPPMSPFSPAGVSRPWNRRSIGGAIRAHIAEHQLPPPIVLTTLPLSADLVGQLGECLHVYYCVDDYGQWPGGYGPALQVLERTLLERVDGVVAVSRALYDTRIPASGRRHYLPHGVDVEFFKAARGGAPHPWLQPLPRPLAGYVGLLDERHDRELWRELVQRRSDWHFVLVGPRTISADFLAEFSNVTVFDAVDYSELPQVYAGLDAALLPYRLQGAGLSLNPLKTREILASGTPLVATPVPELESHAGVVWLAETAEGMANSLVETTGADAQQRWDEVDAMLSGQSWDDKTAELEQVLAEWLDDPEVRRARS